MNIENLNNLATEDIEFLKLLAHELKTQDDFCIAEPLFYKIAEPTIEWGIDNAYSYDKTEICIGETEGCSGEDFIDINDEEAIKERILDYLVDNEEFEEYGELKQELDTCDLSISLDDLLEEYEIKYYYIYGRETVIYHGAFLTYKEAQKHLETNRYHYDSYGMPYIYCDCNWRNPEMERLLIIVKKFEE